MAENNWTSHSNLRARAIVDGGIFIVVTGTFVGAAFNPALFTAVAVALVGLLQI